MFIQVQVVHNSYTEQFKHHHCQILLEEGAFATERMNENYIVFFLVLMWGEAIRLFGLPHADCAWIVFDWSIIMSVSVHDTSINLKRGMHDVQIISEHEKDKRAKSDSRMNTSSESDPVWVDIADYITPCWRFDKNERVHSGRCAWMDG